MRNSRVIALALLVGTFFVAQEALTDLASGRPIRVANDIEVVLRFWVVWALLTPLVLRGGAPLAARRQADRTVRRRARTRSRDSSLRRKRPSR